MSRCKYSAAFSTCGITFPIQASPWSGMIPPYFSCSLLSRSIMAPICCQSFPFFHGAFFGNSPSFCCSSHFFFSSSVTSLLGSFWPTCLSRCLMFVTLPARQAYTRPPHDRYEVCRLVDYLKSIRILLFCPNWLGVVHLTVARTCGIQACFSAAFKIHSGHRG